MEYDDFYNQILNSFKELISSKPSLSSAITPRNDYINNQFRDSRAEWSNIILNSLADIAKSRKLIPEPTRIYFSRDNKGQGHNSRYDHIPRKDDTGEFITDMSWWSPYDFNKWWDQPASKALDWILAVESEWGWFEDNDFEYHCSVVSQDFAKLLFTRAKYKILITSCPSDTNYKDRFKDILSRLRARSGLLKNEVCIWQWNYEDNWSKIADVNTYYP